MERSLATETSRKRIFQAFSRARWLYAMDGVVTCNEREREVGWKRGARVYVLVERSWYTGAPKPPRTTAGSATPLAACRRIPTTAPRPHHGSRFESREKWVEKLYGVWSADYWTGTGRKDVSDSIYTAWIPLRTTGDFLMGQNNRWRRESIIIWKFIFFFFIIAFFICRVSCYEIFVLVQRPLFFVILINCSLVILSSFKLEVFRSNF